MTDGSREMSLDALPDPPYVAVIFTSVRTSHDDEGYTRADAEMTARVVDQPGYLGHDGAREPATGLGITVSYWRSETDARRWKDVAEHAAAQHLGRERWYGEYRVAIARVERAYRFARGADGAG